MAITGTSSDCFNPHLLREAGVMIADISGEGLKQSLLKNNLVGDTTNVPLNAACSEAEHLTMQRGESLHFNP